MKKLLFLLPIVMLSLLMSSCKGDDGPMGPQGNPGFGYYKQGLLKIENKNQWVDKGEYYSASFSVPDLISDVFEYGVVIVYLDLGNEKRPLNLDLPVVDDLGRLYNEEYKFSYSPGNITIELSFSDGIMRVPNLMNFHSVLQVD